MSMDIAPFLALVNHVTEQGFAEAGLRDYFTVSASVAALTDALRNTLS